jgi:hypothetical protein
MLTDAAQSAHCARMKNEFGPNQDQVDALLARLPHVDQGRALLLGSVDPSDPERRRARERMLAAAAHANRQKPLRGAQHEITAWVDHWFTNDPRLVGYGRDVTPGEAATSAAPALLDAVGALVVRDLLTDEDAATLLFPWQELWGEALPDGEATR